MRRLLLVGILPPERSRGWNKQAKGWIDARRAHGAEAKLVILAHSMGGLIARYFLEVLDGWKITRRLYTIGTPHRGSVNAVDFIANGYRPVFWGHKLPELEVFTDLIRWFTSTYQLGAPARRLQAVKIS